MKKLILIVAIFIFPTFIQAHSLLLNVFDNEDNTITVEGIFNTGESGAGALIQLKSKNSNKILYEKRLPDESELTIKIPSEPYLIILDGGKGHKVKKEGIAPIDGFKKVDKDKEEKKDKTEKLNSEISTSKAITFSIIGAFLLLFATILISIKNTNKILKEIQNK